MVDRESGRCDRGEEVVVEVVVVVSEYYSTSQLDNYYSIRSGVESGWSLGKGCTDGGLYCTVE